MLSRQGKIAALGLGPRSHPRPLRSEVFPQRNDPNVHHSATAAGVTVFYSAQAVEALRARGFSNVYSLRGGIDAWQEHISELESEAAAARRGDLETISLDDLEAEHNDT